MKTPKQKLADYLEVEGWEIEKVHEYDLEWWSDEIWELKSRWSPEGVPAYITFLVDPQCDDKNRKKGQEVWGVGNSCSYPTSREGAEENGTISLNSISKNDIEEFLSRLELLRSGAINDTGL